MTSILFKILLVYFLQLWGDTHCAYTDYDFIYDTTVVHGSRRFRVSKTKLNYSFALQHCEQDNSFLAVIDSANLTEVIQVALEKSTLHTGAIVLNDTLSNGSIWIGLKLFHGNKATGRWSNGEIYENTTSYSNWAKDEPQTDECVQLWKASFWMWDDTYCDLERYFICEDQDPKTYTTKQVKSAKESILELAEHNITSKADLNKMSLEVNSILDAVSSVSINETSESQNITTNTILQAIEKISSNYNASENNKFFVNRENVAINISDFTSKDDEGLVLGGYQQYDNNDIATSSIVLSKSLLDEARYKSKDETIQVNSIVYRKSYFFRSSTDNQSVAGNYFGEGPVQSTRSSVLGNVIAVDLIDIPMNNLRTFVVINHVVPISTLEVNKLSFNYNLFSNVSDDEEKTDIAPDVIRRETSIKCVFWDFSLNRNFGGWSDEGCQLYHIAVNNDVINATCRCNHMTNFGILLDTSDYYEPEYLTYVTIVGCIVSITCLLCTLITHLYFKNLRSQVSKQILIHICLSLISLNGFFLLGIDRTSETEFCFAITIILHYALLLAWGWMFVMGIFLFRTFALHKSGSDAGSCFIRTATMLSYVTPGIVVAIVVSLFHDEYQSGRYCWLTGNVLLYSVVIPVAIILLINFLVFGIVLWKIKSSARSQRFQKHLDLKKLIQTLRRAVFMTFVLGLPWIFGYVMLLIQEDYLRTVFATIFTIFNALQGLSIFFLYCVRQEDVRNHYQSTIKRFQRSAATTGGFRKTAPSSETTQTQQTQDENMKKTSTSMSNLSTLSPSYYHAHSTFDTDSNQSAELITVRPPVPPPRPNTTFRY